MHFAVSWLVLHKGSFEHGVARGISNADSALMVSILSGDNGAVPPENIERFTEQLSSVETQPAPKPAPAIRLAGVPDALKSLSAQDYVSAGRLTKLPSPLTEIDLNVAEISELAYAGQTSLTILINADGTVADVISGVEAENARNFAQRVAARFRSARFMPGEIDGMAVRSQLQITVVSEDLPLTDGE